MNVCCIRQCLTNRPEQPGHVIAAHAQQAQQAHAQQAAQHWETFKTQADKRLRGLRGHQAGGGSERLQEQLREQSNRQMQSRQLADLHSASIRNEQFRNAVVRSQANANARQRLRAALDATNTPPPPPEPTIVVVSEGDGSADFGSRNFDVAKWAKKPGSWW